MGHGRGHYTVRKSDEPRRTQLQSAIRTPCEKEGKLIMDAINLFLSYDKNTHLTKGIKLIVSWHSSTSAIH